VFCSGNKHIGFWSRIRLSGLCGIGLVTLVFTLLQAALFPCVAVEPVLVCEKPVYDFGRMDNEETVTHSFVLKNNGSLPIELSKVPPCCGSTLELKRSTVEAGDEIAIKVALSLRGRSGEQKKSFFLKTSDPAHRMIELQLVGTALARVDVRPMAVLFGDLARDEPAVKTVDIVCDTGTTFAITGIVSTVAAFNADFRTDGNRHLITVRVVPPLTMGVNRGVVQVMTDHPVFSVISIPVLARVSADVVAIPDEVIIPLENTGALMRRFALIKSKSNTPFSIIGATTPDPGINVSWQKASSGGWRLLMENIVPDDRLDGKAIVVVTDHPGVKEVMLAIKIVRRQSLK